MASKKYKTKKIGTLNSKLCKELGIINCIGFEIVQSLGLIFHTHKHLNDFSSVNSFNDTMCKIDSIVNKPDFYIYDPIKNSIKFYQKLIDYVCVIVNLTATYSYVSTVYPINKKTYFKLKRKVQNP